MEDVKKSRGGFTLCIIEGIMNLIENIFDLITGGIRIMVSQYRSALYDFIGTEFQSYMDQKFYDEHNTIERGDLYKEL